MLSSFVFTRLRCEFDTRKHTRTSDLTTVLVELLLKLAGDLLQLLAFYFNLDEIGVLIRTFEEFVCSCVTTTARSKEIFTN